METARSQLYSVGKTRTFFRRRSNEKSGPEEPPSGPLKFFAYQYQLAVLAVTGCKVVRQPGNAACQCAHCGSSATMCSCANRCSSRRAAANNQRFLLQCALTVYDSVPLPHGNIPFRDPALNRRSLRDISHCWRTIDVACLLSLIHLRLLGLIHLRLSSGSSHCRRRLWMDVIRHHCSCEKRRQYPNRYQCFQGAHCCLLAACVHSLHHPWTALTVGCQANVEGYPRSFAEKGVLGVYIAIHITWVRRCPVAESKLPKSKRPTRQPQSAGARVRPAVGVPQMPKLYGMKPRKRYLPWSHAERRLERSRNYWICTARPDGGPHSIPVWGFWFEGALYFGTARTSRKSSQPQT